MHKTRPWLAILSNHTVFSTSTKFPVHAVDKGQVSLVIWATVRCAALHTQIQQLSSSSLKSNKLLFESCYKSLNARNLGLVHFLPVSGSQVSHKPLLSVRIHLAKNLPGSKRKVNNAFHGKAGLVHSKEWIFSKRKIVPMVFMELYSTSFFQLVQLSKGKWRWFTLPNSSFQSDNNRAY